MDRLTLIRQSVQPQLYAVILSLALLTFSPMGHAAALSQDNMDSTVRVLCRTDHVSTGSGFVIGEESRHVVTNWHVVECDEDGGKLLVVNNQSQPIAATVLFTNEDKDLAILQLARPLSADPVRFAIDSTVHVGDEVWTAGFPGGADDLASSEDIVVVSVSKGIVSRKVHSREFVALLQTEASINPGNSGGPLFDEFGRVVGINVAKSLALVPTVQPDNSVDGASITLQRLPLAEGIGWAISVDELLPELDRLGIDYDIDRSKPSWLMRLWYREPALLSVILFGLGVLSLGTGWLLFLRERPVSLPVVRAAAVAKPQMQPQLRCLQGEYAGHCLDLTFESIAIGRDPNQCQLVIAGTYTDVGRKHCSLRFDRDESCFWLSDHGSANGTFVQNQRLDPERPYRLKAGDVFHLASPLLSFQVQLKP